MDENYDLGSLKELLESDSKAPEGKENPTEISVGVGILLTPMGVNIMTPDMPKLLDILDHEGDTITAALGCLRMFFPAQMRLPRDTAQFLSSLLVYVMTHFDMSQEKPNDE